jgi:PEP-CTERM motif
MISGLTRNVSVMKTALLTIALVFLVQRPAAADVITFTWTDTGSGFLYDNPNDFNQLAQFTDASFQIFGTGNTDNVVFGTGECLGSSDNCARLNLSSATFHIADVTDGSTDFGSVTFTFDPGAARAFVDNDTGVEGFSQTDINGRDLYYGPNVPSGSLPWFMKTRLGPITDLTTPLGDWQTITNVPATGSVTCDDPDPVKRGNCQLALAGKVGGLDLSGLTLRYPVGCDSTFNGTGRPCTNSLGTFDAEVSSVPEPSSVLLLGAGLVGVSLIIRRRQAAQVIVLEKRSR